MFPSSTHSSGELGLWCGGGLGKLRSEGLLSQFGLCLDYLERDLSDSLKGDDVVASY